jgi:hypothetical protein
MIDSIEAGMSEEIDVAIAIPPAQEIGIYEGRLVIETLNAGRMAVWISLTQLPAVVDMDPDVLNPRSNGRYVTAYIELPEGYDPAEIDVSTVMLNETVNSELEPTAVGDHDEDGVPDRMVKFSRPAAIGILPGGDQVEVTVTGDVGGFSFAGTDTIRVLMPRITHPNGGEILGIGGEYTVVWEAPTDYRADYYCLYYTADDGESWSAIATNIADTSCTWAIPDVLSDSCRVLVEAFDGRGIMGYDITDGMFTICAGAGVDMGERIPTRFALHRTSPNPFKRGTLIRFDLPRDCHVKLAIHDVRGRLVKELVSGMKPAGYHSAEWSGEDTFAGGKAAAGIYFISIEAGPYEATGKIVLVR